MLFAVACWVCEREVLSSADLGQGLQSNAEYAEVFIRSKWRQSQWGPARLERVGLVKN